MLGGRGHSTLFRGCAGGGGRRVTRRACVSGGGEDGPNRPQRGPISTKPLQASPLASAAAVCATGLSLSANNSSINTHSFGLPVGGFITRRNEEDVSIDVAVAGLSPTALYMNKHASLAECCTSNAKWTSRDVVLFPRPFEQHGMRI